MVLTSLGGVVGNLFNVYDGRGILPVLSDTCDELFSNAPIIKNELLNRSVLSSAAAAARMRLIERMFSG